MTRKRAAIDRFAEKIAYTDSGCVEWIASLNNKGYGSFGVEGCARVQLAHRWSYEYHVGPILEGLSIDHLCRNRSCVNPDHLEPVTQQTNLLRSEKTWPAKNAAKTHCPAGHQYSGSNLYLPPSGGRKCMTCIRRQSLARSDKPRIRKAA